MNFLLPTRPPTVDPIHWRCFLTLLGFTCLQASVGVAAGSLGGQALAAGLTWFFGLYLFLAPLKPDPEKEAGRGEAGSET